MIFLNVNDSWQFNEIVHITIVGDYYQLIFNEDSLIPIHFFMIRTAKMYIFSQQKLVEYAKILSVWRERLTLTMIVLLVLGATNFLFLTCREKYVNLRRRSKYADLRLRQQAHRGVHSAFFVSCSASVFHITPFYNSNKVVLLPKLEPRGKQR